MKKKLSELFYNCAYTIQYQQAGDSVNYAFVEDKDTLYIYFEGSNSISDWVRNFLFPAKPYKDMKIPYRVHRGFLAAWKEVEDIIIQKITETQLREAVKEERAQGLENVWDFRWRHIVVIGYSHGGALSGLCYECCWFYRPDLREEHLEGYGFESPRFYAGWHVKEELKERWQNYKVIRTNNDIVTHCPPVIFGFCHVGEMLKVKGDVSLVENKAPKCVKSHYPQVVYDALLKYEEENG